MRKVLMILLTLALIFSMAGAVSAAEKTVGMKADSITVGSGMIGSGETIITYSVSDTYDLYIPSDFHFDPVYDVVKTKVNATNVVISKNEKLNVTVTSVHGWRLLEHNKIGNEYVEETDHPEFIAYTLSFNLNSNPLTYTYGNDYDDILVLSVLNGDSTGETALTFTLGDQSQITTSAHYQDKLIFESKIETV